MELAGIEIMNLINYRFVRNIKPKKMNVKEFFFCTKSSSAIVDLVLTWSSTSVKYFERNITQCKSKHRILSLEKKLVCSSRR